MTAAKKIDSKGRLLLGEGLAGTMVLVEKRENGEFIIRPAIVVPAQEKWLFENQEALNAVFVGLKEAREGEIVEKPSFARKKAWKQDLAD